MAPDDFANLILKAVGNDKSAIKKVSEALVSGDVAKIREVLSELSVEISEEDAMSLVKQLGPDPKQAVDQAVAYWT